jgi:hypothetical protein
MQGEFLSSFSSIFFLLFSFISLSVYSQNPPGNGAFPKDDGYRGIWYAVGSSGDEYKYKYSGGLATYPQQHLPLAVYSKEANKTFFCYGGRSKEKNEILITVSYFDHATGMVPRPTILLNKKTDDAHDNPTINLDDNGYVWVFSNSHGGGRPAYIHKSKKPFSIDDFELVLTDRFSYSQPQHLPGKGFLFLHTRYNAGKRFLYSMTSNGGSKWSEPKPLAQVEKGHYQVSASNGSRVGTAFNVHPEKGGLDYRTNLYYMETHNMGQSWETVDGKSLSTPLITSSSLALVHNYKAENLLVYLKDLQFDEQEYPVIMYLTSKGFESGPKNDPRTWQTARWNGTKWDINPITESDNNYDFGSLYIEKDGKWKLIAPTERGPQAYNTGGEIAIWTSEDKGRTWKKVKQLTLGSKYNHTYVRRPVNAHPDFYALWADGHGREESPSSLYFTDWNGDHVWRLPTLMEGDYAKPEMVK